MNEWLARLPRGHYLAILALVAIIGLLPQFLSRTLPDISFLLYAAGRVLDGATLYVDLIEINPPLIVWLNIPIVALARAVGADEITLYRLIVTLLLTASVAVCASILRSIETRSNSAVPSRRLSVLLLTFALFVLPRLDWGEREHLMLALVLPYVLLAWARVVASPSRLGLSAQRAILIGCAAGIGIAIKPQFALVWLVREGVVLWKNRRSTPEGITVPVIGILYLGAVLLLTPEYFGVLRTFGPAYQTFMQNPLLVTALLGDGAAVALAALLIAFALRGSTSPRSLTIVLAGATAACYLAAVLQQKGWRYHFYPALAFGWILLLATWIMVRSRRRIDRLFASIAGAAALTMAISAVAGAVMQSTDPLNGRYDADPHAARLIPLLRELAQGQPIMILSPNMASGFPLATYAGVKWEQRYTNLWPLVAAYDSAIEADSPIEYRSAGTMANVERIAVNHLAEDLRRTRPAVIIASRAAGDEPRWDSWRLDPLKLLNRSELFRSEFSGYEPAGSLGLYDLYVRADRGLIRSKIAPKVLISAAPDEAAPAELRIRRGAIPLTLVFLGLLALIWRFQVMGHRVGAVA